MKQQRKLDARDYDLWVYVWWVATYILWAHRPTSVACRFIGSKQASQQLLGTGERRCSEQQMTLVEQRTDARGPGSSMPVASIRISAQFSVQVTQVGIVDVERWPSGDAVCQCVSGLEMTQRRPGVCASGLLQQVNKRAMDGMNGRSGQVQKRYMYIPPRYLRW